MTRASGEKGARGSFKSMRARCNDPNHISFARYGARGVKVCPQWDNFAAFFRDMGPRPPGATLDRINTEGDYEPSNCRWSTPCEQRRNWRQPPKLSVEIATQAAIRALSGETFTSVASEFNVDRRTISRIVAGEIWPEAAALALAAIKARPLPAPPASGGE